MNERKNDIQSIKEKIEMIEGVRKRERMKDIENR